jgi:sulfate permease, SulP family
VTIRDFVEARVPALAWMPRYKRAWLRSDAIAGVTAASVIIPKAMAYATVAGLAVQVGLYTALLPMATYAMLGSSLRLSVSTTTTIGILTAAQIAEFALNAPAGEAAAVATTLSVLVGILLVVAAVFRLGFVAQFISEPVLTGFKAGIGIVIVVDQLPKVLGLHVPHGSLLQTILGTVQMLPTASLVTMAVGLSTIAVMVLLESRAPRAPAPLVGVALGIAASALLGLKALGVDTVGHIPPGLPHVTLPDTSLAPTLWAGALGIALISFTESVAAGRAFVQPGERRPDANQELLALGVGNVLGGLTGAMPSGGGTSQTAVNTRAGARSPMASLVTVAATAGVLLFLAPLIALMPQATLAAVVIVTSIGLIAPLDFAAIRQVGRTEFRWAIIAMLGVITLGTLRGILVAIVLSMLSLLRQANNPAVHMLGRKPGTDVFRPRSPDHPEDESFAGILILRPEGRMYFANAQRIVDKIAALVDAHQPSLVLLDLRAVPDIEFTGVKALTELEDSMRRADRRLVLAALNPDALSAIQRAPLGALLGRERMFFSVSQAVAKCASQEAGSVGLRNAGGSARDPVPDRNL